MGRIKTFANAGSLLPADLNNIEDDYEYGFSTYKTILAPSNNEVGAVTAQTYWLIMAGGAIASGVPSANGIFDLDPADYAVGSPNARTTKLRLKVRFATNAVAPAITYTFGLYPLTVSRGSSGNINTWTMGTVTPGSTVAFASPAANSTTASNSGDFTAPAAGEFLIGMVASGSSAAGARADAVFSLQVRQV